VRCHFSPCGICGGQSGSRKCFFPPLVVLLSSPISSFHHYLTFIFICTLVLTERANLGHFPKRNAVLGNRRAVNRKDLPLFNVRSTLTALPLDVLSKPQTWLPPLGSPIPFQEPVHLPPSRDVLLTVSAPPSGSGATDQFYYGLVLSPKRG